jgi:hypothetical protein
MMGKYQQECDYHAMISNQAEEIERLNAHIIVLSDALNFECGDRCNAEYNPCNAREALNISGIDVGNWLTTHDQKVRDDALEEAAWACEGIFVDDDIDVANEIRAMKGTK